MQLRTLSLIVGIAGITNLAFWVMLGYFVAYHYMLGGIGGVVLLIHALGLLGFFREKAHEADPGVRAYSTKGYWITMLVVSCVSIVLWIILGSVVSALLPSRDQPAVWGFCMPGMAISIVSVVLCSLALHKAVHERREEQRPLLTHNQV